MRSLQLGTDCEIHETVHIVSPDEGQQAPFIGDDAVIRSQSILYPDVVIDSGLQTGHCVLVREETTIGSDALLGTNSVIDGRVGIGDSFNMQTGVYVPPETEIGDRVFLGPRAVLANDPYPTRQSVELAGPTLEDDVSVGANATVLPDVTIGERSFVAAGATVTDDVPPETLAVGTPARHQPLPDRLNRPNSTD